MEQKPREKDIPARVAWALILSAPAVGALVLGIKVGGSEDDRRSPVVSPSQPHTQYTAVTPATLAPNPLPVTNISGHPIDISSNPNVWTPDISRGLLAVGETAIAGCVVSNVAYPQSTELYVKATELTSREGYITVYPPSYIGNDAPGPADNVPQINVTLSDIKTAHLPEC